ncbi:MAG: hypothetical protein DELT_01250 [Desulfovibrio sp.]
MKYKTLFARCLLAFVLVLPAFATGCATVEDTVSFDLASQPVIYKDQWARREPPLVYVHPAENSDVEMTAVFMPFRVTQSVSDPEIIGYSQARTVWHTWLSKRLFSIMEFDGDHGPYRRDVAINLARSKGADLAIGGFVTYYFAGGSDADSQVALQVEIYDAASGQLVWSMAQSALMPARKVNDYIIFATETRGPSDPMYALTKAMAEDMGNVVAKWVPQPESATKPTGLLDRLRNFGKKEPAPKPAYPTF